MTNPKLQYVGRMQWKWEHVGEDLQYVLSCIFTVQKLAFSKQDLSINFRDLAPPPQKHFASTKMTKSVSGFRARGMFMRAIILCTSYVHVSICVSSCVH